MIQWFDGDVLVSLMFPLDLCISCFHLTSVSERDALPSAWAVGYLLGKKSARLLHGVTGVLGVGDVVYSIPGVHGWRGSSKDRGV